MEETRSLIIAEISDVITSAQKVHLDQLRMQDVAVKALSDQLYEKLAPEKTGINELVFPTVQELIDRAKLRQRRKRTRMLAIVTVSMAACLLAAVFIIRNIYYHEEKRFCFTVSGKVIPLEGSLSMTIENGMIKTNDNHIIYRYDENGSPTIAALNVPPGKKFDLILQDKSVVELNPESRLLFSLGKEEGSTRNFKLEKGEVYVIATPNEKRPLVFDAVDLTTTVLGTEFNVKRYETEGATISLVEGRLSVTNGTESCQLKSGEEIISAGFHVRKFDVDEVAGWRRGLIRFDSATPEDIKRAVKKFYDKDLVIDKNIPESHTMFNLDLNESLHTNMESYSEVAGLSYDSINCTLNLK
ncbi:FecR family protein [Chitinophaga sp. S165]|nr:FecR family protein [Chitinophaga sp. S165]